MITFDHVSFSYPEVALPALHDVNLTLLESAFTLISGPSGAGKTTLLRCLNGLVPHFSGGVLAGQIRVGDLDPATGDGHAVGFQPFERAAQVFRGHPEE